MPKSSLGRRRQENGECGSRPNSNRHANGSIKGIMTIKAEPGKGEATLLEPTG
jgi:hypothetical protein